MEELGNIIKINMYVEIKRKVNDKLKLETIEKIILEYNSWIRNTNREDKMETYEEFLKAQ